MVENDELICFIIVNNELIQVTSVEDFKLWFLKWVWV